MNITITEAAKQKILEATKEVDFKKSALRLVFSGIGCGGPRLGLAIDESEKTNDPMIVTNEITVIYDSDIARFIDTGTNYTKMCVRNTGSGLKIHNFLQKFYSVISL